MKSIIFILLNLLVTTSLFCQNNQKEILLIGTMHTVPKIVKGAYEPLYYKALKYNPEAIFVESPKADDDRSWEYLKNGWSAHYKSFYNYSDSISRVFLVDQERINKILKSPLKLLNKSDFAYMTKYYASIRDNANYEYYVYLYKNGIKGKHKPTRHEDGDLSYKLAAKLDLKYIHSMDDQQTNKEYHEAWSQCVKDGAKNGDNKINQEINKKDYNKAKLPALFGRLGRYTNSDGSVLRCHQLASFNYVNTMTEACKNANEYWNQRNQRIVHNTAKQIINSNTSRHLMVIGAAHVYGVEEYFKKFYPDIKITRVFK